MTNTLTALQASGGFRGHIVVAIEGYDYVLTDSVDTAGAATAWAATPWTQALSGVELAGDIVDEFMPWSDSFRGSSVSLLVRPDALDTFATEVFATEKGNLTVLRTGLEVDAASVSVPVVEHAEFAASGTAYIGNERIAYTSKSGAGDDELLGATRGQFAPFNRNGSTAHTFQHNHRIFNDSEHHKEIPEVTDAPRSWVGRWVGVWIHKVQAGTWETKAEAHLVYAGRISGIHEIEEGTRIDLTSIIKEVFERKIFQDQYKGHVAEGIELLAGRSIIFVEDYTTSAPTRFYNEDRIDIVSGAATDPTKITAGRYSLHDLMRLMNDAVQYMRNTLGTLDAYWGIGLQSTDNGGTRSSIRATFPNPTSFYVRVRIEVIVSIEVAVMLGHRLEAGQKTKGTKSTLVLMSEGSSTGAEPLTELSIVSQEPPKRIIGFQATDSDTGSRTNVTLDLEIGTWINNLPWLPPALTGQHLFPGEYGIIMIGKTPFIARRDGDSSFAVLGLPALSRMFGGELSDNWQYAPPTINVDESGELEVKQVFAIRKPFEWLLPRLLASIQGNGYNHANYDELPFGIGAGIPWELLGQNLLDDSERIALIGDWDLQVVLDRPMSIGDLIGPEFVVRAAFPYFRSGLRMASMRGPVVTSETVALSPENESNPPQMVAHADFEVSDAAIVNAVKINYNVDANGQFQAFTLAQSAASISRHGHRSVEISLRSTYGQWVGPVNTIRAVTRMISKEVLPIFARPLILIRRSIPPSIFFQLSPGDVVTLTDSHIRNPKTGTRGITNHPAMVKRQTLNLGMGDSQMFCQVELMLWEADRASPFCPSGLIDQDADSGGFTDGYNSTTNAITIKAHEYSDATEDADADAFEVGDEIEIVRIHDESGGSSASLVTYQRDITAISGNILTLGTPNLGSGGGETAWDGTELHRVLFADYLTSTADQRSEHAYQAGANQYITGPASANVNPILYYRDVSSIATRQASTKQAEAIGSTSSVYYGDGKPISAGVLNQLARNIDNMIDYYTAINAPMSVPEQQEFEVPPDISTATSVPSTDEYRFTFFVPIFVGRGRPGGKIIKLRISPRARLTGASASWELRCYASSLPPGGDGSFGGLSTVRVREPYERVSWTLSATTYAALAAEDIQIQDCIGPNGIVWLHFAGHEISGPLGVEIAMTGLTECRVLPTEV